MPRSASDIASATSSNALIAAFDPFAAAAYVRFHIGSRWLCGLMVSST